MSALVSTQEALQFVVTAAHTRVHAPPEQVSEAAHAVLQSPQCARSEARSTHFPAQAPYPAWQATSHFPAVQIAAPFGGVGHVVLQVPQ